MLFSSIPFIYYFFALTILVYSIAPKALKNFVLLVFSLAFYAYGEPKYVILMAITIILGYACGILIEKFRGKTGSKFFVVLSVVLSLSALGYFKYADFFIANFNAATGLSIPLLRIALPIGISFYTFQILSYTVDVYRGNVPAQKNLITLATYITLFPQLIAGPIVRYSDVEKQLVNRAHTFEKTASGISRLILGLAKKIIIANQLGELCDSFLSTDGKSVLFYWFYAFCYMLQIYFDFSGYSDMAIGLGRIFGFKFMENFNYPYISSSIAEFWRRWHISLGSWFRDYVYIPLGGNRVSKLLWFRNIFVVWMLTGFWHGAAWNFVVWGLYFAILLIVEKFFFTSFLEKHRIFSHIYVLFLVTISFVIFSVNSLGEIATSVGGMFGAGGLPLVTEEFIFYFRNYAVLFIIGVAGATPLPKKIIMNIKSNSLGEKFVNLAEIPFLAILTVIITAFLVDGSFNPFLYFRF